MADREKVASLLKTRFLGVNTSNAHPSYWDARADELLAILTEPQEPVAWMWKAKTVPYTDLTFVHPSEVNVHPDRLEYCHPVYLHPSREAAPVLEGAGEYLWVIEEEDGFSVTPTRPKYEKAYTQYVRADICRGHPSRERDHE
jgi:hypothetical protein